MQTFDKIVDSAKETISEAGIINLRTLDVAKRAGVAHGTLFSHFSTKELLVSEVCKIELKKIAIELKKLIETKNDIKWLLTNYLSLIAKNEDFHVVIAKEFPFINENIQKSIIGNETILKNILYKKIEEGNEIGVFHVRDITITVSFFFATVNYYLSRKEYFVKGKTKLMDQKNKQIVETFMGLLSSEKRDISI